MSVAESVLTGREMVAFFLADDPSAVGISAARRTAVARVDDGLCAGGRLRLRLLQRRRRGAVAPRTERGCAGAASARIGAQAAGAVPVCFRRPLLLLGPRFSEPRGGGRAFRGGTDECGGSRGGRSADGDLLRHEASALPPEQRPRGMISC